MGLGLGLVAKGLGLGLECLGLEALSVECWVCCKHHYCLPCVWTAGGTIW